MKRIMSEKARIILIICTAICLVSLCALLSYKITVSSKTSYAYPVICAVPSEPILSNSESTNFDLKGDINFDELLKVNSQTIAWISAKGLGISEPIVQAGDNEKYLDYSFRGDRTGEGAVFLDYACKEQLESKHVVIYGHNLLDGGMFSPLADLKDVQSFNKLANDITIITPQKKIKLKIIAVTAAGSNGNRRTCEFRSNWVFDKFVKDMLESCELKNIPEEKIEKLYTFITCSYEGADFRTYVYAIET